MPPPSLSITTNVAGASVRRAGRCVVQEAQVAAQADDRTPHARVATPTTVDTKPSMPFAPRFAKHREAGARRHAPLERADRQARRDDERGAVGQRRGDVARDVAFELRSPGRRATRSIARARPRSASSHAVEPRDRRRCSNVVGDGARAAARRRPRVVRSPRGADRATRRRDRRAPAGSTGRATRSRSCS